MILVEALFSTGRVTLAVASPKELFQIIWVIDNSSETVAWKIVDHKPTDYGWSPYWKRLAETFTQEHYVQSRN